MSYKLTLWLLFGLFVVINTAYLHRVPGLMGDEGSEGENVYELLDHGGVTVVGERSYIGPLIDYVRVPFIKIFGYTALALRLPIWLATLATFWLTASVVKKMFGLQASLMAMAFGLFSPAFVLESRLGWAITLLPFFALAVIWLLLSDIKHKWLIAGLTAGLGLANHILFLPALVGIVFGTFVYSVPGLFKQPRLLLGKISGILLALLGFWAGFGMQFTVLQMFTDDQGDPPQVAQLYSQRLATLPTTWWQYLSGSVYISRYSGQILPPVTAAAIAGVVSLLLALQVILNWRDKNTWAWLGGLTAGLLVLLYVIDRHSLRYFTWFAFGFWLLSGIGLGKLLSRWHEFYSSLSSLAIAIILSLWLTLAVFLPFLETGGSTNDFTLIDRTQSADALVDVRPLVACLRGQEPVFSENIHIYNRLQFLSHNFTNLKLASSLNEAKWLVYYRKPIPGVNNNCPTINGSRLCPQLNHFCVLPK